MGIIVSITGVSGAGKTTIAREILGRKENARMIESITTRLRRPSDIPGEYRYVTEELFRQLDNMRSFLWTVDHAGTRYGTMSESIIQIIEMDNAIGFMILTPHAIERLRLFLSSFSAMNTYVPIFLETPPGEVLGHRIAERGDDMETIRRRLEESADWEHNARTSSIPFRFVGNNRPIEETVSEVLTLF